MKTIINLKANNAYEKAVLTYLEENASKVLVEKINSGKKTLGQCFDYIKKQAQEQAVNGCAVIEDKEVFGWAIHFFEEDDVTIEPVHKPSNPTTVKESQPINKTQKPVETKHEEQLSLFSLL